MGVIAAGVVAAGAAVGAGATIYSATKSAAAQRAAAAQQMTIAQQGFAQNEQLLSILQGAADTNQSNAASYISDARSSIAGAYGQIQNLISNIPSVSQEYPTAQNLSASDFAFRDSIQKSNLAFEVGSPGAMSDLRSSQSVNAALANYDPSGFNQGENNIINSKLLDLKALTVGEPTGSFANLSAQNLNAFSQQGLSNELQTADFFRQNGTVDPISPLQTAFQLQGVDQSMAGLGIQGAEWQGSALAGIDATGISASAQAFNNELGLTQLGIGANNALTGQLSNAAGANALAAVTQAQGTQVAASQLNQGLAQGFSLNLQSQALNNQQVYNNNLLNTLSQNRNYAPSSVIGGSVTGGSNYTFQNGAYVSGSAGGDAFASADSLGF